MGGLPYMVVLAMLLPAVNCIYIRWHNKQPHKHNVHNEGKSPAEWAPAT